MGIYGLLLVRIIYPALRWFGWSVVLLYVVIALTVLGTRYVLFPKAEHYKTYVEAQLSSLLDSRVELGHISANWHRLNPRIEMDQITLYDSRGTQVLTIPHLSAVVSWRSLLTWSPQFVSVYGAGVDLSVRRDKERRFWLLGRSVTDDTSTQHNTNNNGATLGDKTMQWLVSQPQIQLSDSTIRWIDDVRDAPPLTLHKVNLKIRNRGQQHQFSLAARPAAAVGGTFDMRGNLRRSADQNRPVALETGYGQLYVHIDDMRPEAWQPWVDWPASVGSDRVSVRTWLDVEQGKVLDLTADIQLSDAQWHGSDMQSVQSRSARLYVKGPWQSLQRLTLHNQDTSGPDALTQRDGDAQPGLLDFRLQAHGLEVSLPDQLDQPVVINALGMGGKAGHGDDGLILRLPDVTLQNKDIEFAGDLNWTPGSDGGLGYIDASARVSRASLAAVHRYMPRWLDDDVRQWLEEGLLAGQIHDARVVVRGDLSTFPFDDAGSDGEFLIQGPYRDAVIDYVPKDAESAGWPRLNAVQGWVELDRASLRIKAETAQITPVDGALIHLEEVDAHIGDLNYDSVLKVSGETQGDGAAYLAFLQHSDLNGLLNYAFDQTTGQGTWRLPLALTIPLADPDNTAASGVIHIADGSIRFDPQSPPFEAVEGDIEFSEEHVSLEALSARFLNENVTLSGGVGPGQAGLRMAGQISAQALSTLFDVPGMVRFEGKTGYIATLTGLDTTDDAEHATLTLTSDLQGMAMDFPPPLNKASDATWPVHVTWAHGDKDARRLDVTLNNTMHGRFVRHGHSSSSAYFHSGSVGVGRVAEPSDAGLNVDIALPVFDGDAWDAITREFSSSSDDDGQRPVFPEIRTLRVQAERGRLLGLPLDELTYTVRQGSATQWRADISSTQTAGTLTWNQEGDQIQGPVQAIFHRLAYGDDPGRNESDESEQRVDEDTNDSLVDDNLRIPAINLIIENLNLYGRHVGRLALVGVNEDRGDTWRLEQFALSSPSAHLEGRGVWRLRGANRGLTLDADVDVSDLGDYFDQIGFNDLLSAGDGTAHVNIDWHDLPWSFDVGKIDGQLSFEFTKGRLSTVNSRSARLLELISLQSARRLATLDLNPLTLTHDGFPYDVLRGTLRLEHGRVYTEDYRITGPVGTVVLDGLVHLKTGELDLQAVVVPNLDVSGAAIAAGVAINPVVGIGAFLTQWLLKGPLAAAMTAQYKIGGDWEQPEIQAVERIRGQAEGDDP